MSTRSRKRTQEDANLYIPPTQVKKSNRKLIIGPATKGQILTKPKKAKRLSSKSDWDKKAMEQARLLKSFTTNEMPSNS